MTKKVIIWLYRKDIFYNKTHFLLINYAHVKEIPFSKYIKNRYLFTWRHVLWIKYTRLVCLIKRSICVINKNQAMLMCACCLFLPPLCYIHCIFRDQGDMQDVTIDPCHHELIYTQALACTFQSVRNTWSIAIRWQGLA